MAQGMSDISRRNPQDFYELVQKIGSGTYGDVYKVNLTFPCSRSFLCVVLVNDLETIKKCVEDKKCEISSKSKSVTVKKGKSVTKYKVNQNFTIHLPLTNKNNVQTQINYICDRLVIKISKY